MNRTYLIYVNGILAKRALTIIKAKQIVKELTAKGYKMVSLAEALDA